MVQSSPGDSGPSVPFDQSGLTRLAEGSHFVGAIPDVCGSEDAPSPHCCVYSGHSDSVICLEGAQGKVVSGSVDGTIRLWSSQRPSCEAVLEGHTDWVRCLHARGSLVISGSDDGTIRFWDTEQCTCVKVLQTHSVNCLQLFADVVFYGSEDGHVFVVDCESGSELAQLQGHTQSVNSMAVWDEGDALLTGSGDCTVRIWSLASHQCLRVLRHHAFSVNCLKIRASVLFTGSGDCTLQALRLSDDAASVVPTVFAGHTSPIFCLHVAQDVLFSGSGDCSVRVWNTSTAQCLLHLPGSPGMADIMHATGHMDWVNAIYSEGDMVFSGSVDKTIRRWHIPSLVCGSGAAGASFHTSSSLMLAQNYRSGRGGHASSASMYDTLAWGHNQQGALGLGTTDPVVTPMPIIALQGLVVTMFACGGGSEEHHSAAVTSAGAIYTWGSGRSGQLGQGDEEDLVMPHVVSSPLLQGQQVVEVACGSAHTVIVTHSGAVLSWGWGHFGQLGTGSHSNSLEPVRVIGLDAVIIYRVACGSAHTAVISDTGQVYTWGWGVNGQLGHGDDVTRPTPTLIKRLQTVYISHVSCGLAHTVAVSEVDKQVYSWGWDEYGQLGQGIWDLFGANKNRWPRPIRDLQGKLIKTTACGSSHTLALSCKGEVYAFGWGRDGQLGLGTVVKEKKNPVLIKGLPEIACVAACGSHSIAIDTKGCVWVWGHNLVGQLGLGHTKSVSSPAQMSALGARSAKQIACAGGVKFGHTLALLQPDTTHRHAMLPANVGRGELVVGGGGGTGGARGGAGSEEGEGGRGPIREESDEGIRQVLQLLSRETGEKETREPTDSHMPQPPAKPRKPPPPPPNRNGGGVGVGHAAATPSAAAVPATSSAKGTGGVGGDLMGLGPDLGIEIMFGTEFEGLLVEQGEGHALANPAPINSVANAASDAGDQRQMTEPWRTNQADLTTEEQQRAEGRGGPHAWGDEDEGSMPASGRHLHLARGDVMHRQALVHETDLEDVAAESPSAANLESLSSGIAVVTPRERLLQLCQRVKSAVRDQSVGLSRLLEELEGVIEDKRSQKKELVRVRKDLTLEENDVHVKRRLALERLADEARAERFEMAAELERQVRECDARLHGCEVERRLLLQRYEALDSHEEECGRKIILARREAFKFLSSVEQDARAKVQQYAHDAHAWLEEQRICAVRREQALQSEDASLRMMQQELDAALSALSSENAAEIQAHEKSLSDAKDKVRVVREEREAIECQIQALKRALVVKQEEERRALEEEQNAQTHLQSLLDTESSNSATLRTDRGRVASELHRVMNEIEEVSKVKETVAVGDELLQTAQELSSETLSSLALVISEATATLQSSETDQRRRHELSLRRRTLLSDDGDSTPGGRLESCSSAGGGNKDDNGKMQGGNKDEEQVMREKRECEQRIAELSGKLLEAQQQLTKKKQELATWDSQLVELQMRKQMAVDKRAFRDASSINSEMKALSATREVGARDLQQAVDALAVLGEELNDSRLRADALALEVQDSNERKEEEKTQLLMSQAAELQLLMEDEIESSSYEAAALLQVEIEWIHERCRRLQLSVQHGATNAEMGGGLLRADSSPIAHVEGGPEVALRGGEGVFAVGSGVGQDVDAGSAERVALQERINLLHLQLEAALGEEDFELCDALNAEITSLIHQRDALLDPERGQT